MAVDLLHTMVSSAIWRAEQLDELGREAVSSWLEVSRLEEELSTLLPATEPEGRIARRGAVRAALKAHDFIRAQNLVSRYADEGVSEPLRKEYREALKANAKLLSDQFPHAAKHHRPTDVQRMASLLVERGPFFLAA